MTESKPVLLIAEDDLGLQSQLRWHFEAYEVVVAPDRKHAVAAVRMHEPAVVLQDLGLPPDEEGVEEGFATIQETLRIAPNTKIIVVTGYHDYENALRAVALGAYDFYQKPVNTDTLDLIVQRAYQMWSLEQENLRLQQNTQSPLPGVIASDERMASVCKIVERLAPTDVTCLVLGESGTGKEVIARAIHNLSERKDKRFVAINCAAVPENLMESELFGYEKGAFTGASQRRVGRFEQADGGTLFLDEIGDMPPEAQTRLLRVLADGEFYRVGGHTPVKANVRIIAATHQNLEQLVAENRFREDLFHRLNVIRIHLPKLADRREDIPQLIQHFFRAAAKELDMEPKVLAPDVEDYMQQLPWHGNVRQLQNTCRWLTVMASGREVHMDDLPAELKDQPVTTETSAPTHTNWQQQLRQWIDRELAAGKHHILHTAVPDFERTVIEAALSHTKGRKKDAAELLGWGRNTLTRKLKELDMGGED